MSRYWSSLVESLSPYVPGEQPAGNGLVKLNTNENPFPPSPQVLDAIAGITADQLKRYPDPQSLRVREALGGMTGLSVEQIFVGNGSDEVLALAFMGLLKHDLPLYFPDITYSFYPVWCDLAGVDYRTVELRQDFTLDSDCFPDQNGGIIFSNPNAPTGLLLPLADIERLLRRCSGSVVVIDEAYIDFGGESAISLVNEYKNLLVVQTVSKSRSLAGLRVGFAFGDAALIEGLDRVKNSFNSYPLDVLAQNAVVASFADEAYFRSSCQRVIEGREHLIDGLEKLGFAVLPSAANFVFASHPERQAKELFPALRECGVIVRYFDKPKIDNYLRISVGTEEECGKLLAALERILG